MPLRLVAANHRRQRRENIERDAERIKDTQKMPKKTRDSNERDPGAFSFEDERGAEHDGKGATKSRNPLAPTPKSTS
ncbi:MAG: hypothetical protein Q8R25_03675 [bacterium]|nr:hypothetical protein [bacterium]